MEILLQHLQTYYRRKRIRNIVYLDSQVDLAAETNISPPIWPRFLIQILLWVGLSLLLGSLVALLQIAVPVGAAMGLLLMTSWLSVELTDAIWLNFYKQIKLILNAVSILFVLLVAIALAWVFFDSGSSQRLRQWHTEVNQWHTEVNQALQKNTVASVQILGAAEGENWKLLQGTDGNLQPVTAAEARSVCSDRLGSGWQLPRPKQLQTLRPHPSLSRSVYVWASNSSNELLLTRLGQSSLQSGNTYVSYESYSLYPVLCYNAKP